MCCAEALGCLVSLVDAGVSASDWCTDARSCEYCCLSCLHLFVFALHSLEQLKQDVGKHSEATLGMQLVSGGIGWLKGKKAT